MDIVKFLKKNKIIWAIFGNDDDPYPPSWFMKERSEWLRQLIWYCRNPLHNFFWNIIGFRKYPLDYSQIWNQKQRWNLVLPFFSYRGKKVEFYLGWRPDRKALGFAFRIKKYKEE